ncbi:MAG: TauD/TfdA family dioxygenase [Xenophilus sp.]
MSNRGMHRAERWSPAWTCAGRSTTRRRPGCARSGTLFEHQARPEFVYDHRWPQDMLVAWNNRCVTHAATGGCEGHRRLLHRITVTDRTLR